VPEDRYGLGVTTASPRAFDLYCVALDRALADQGGADDLLRAAVEEDDGFALAWALLGLQQRGAGDITGGNKSIVRARAAASGLGEREQSHVAVLERFVALDVLGCEAAMRDHLSSWPRDAVIVLQAHFLHNVFDWRPDRERRLLDLATKVAPAYGDDWFMAAELAFAVDESGDHDRSRDLAERALDANAMNARAAHGMSHALLEGSQAEPGARWLEPWLAGWEHAGPFACHLWWHLALFRLAEGDEDGARRAFDEIWRFRGLAVGVATDAPSLAWRLRLDGAGDSLPWHDLVLLPDRPGFTFGNAHRALVLAGVGDVDGLDAYAEALTALVARGHPTAGACATFVRALAAHINGDHQVALRHLAEAAPAFRSFGGSHAQGEVFEDTAIAVLAAAGERDDAERLLRARLERRRSVRDERWLGRLAG
jgi:hypothetical protein